MNVVEISDYRAALRRGEESSRDAAELASMTYDEALAWASSDFWRLAAVAKARDYRPEWIEYRMAEYGCELTAQQAEAIKRMVAEAGPYLSSRRRWIMRQINSGCHDEGLLIERAKSAAPFRHCTYVDRCVRNDLATLARDGLIMSRTCGTAPASQSCERRRAAR